MRWPWDRKKAPTLVVNARLFISDDAGRRIVRTAPLVIARQISWVGDDANTYTLDFVNGMESIEIEVPLKHGDTVMTLGGPR